MNKQLIGAIKTTIALGYFAVECVFVMLDIWYTQQGYTVHSNAFYPFLAIVMIVAWYADTIINPEQYEA